MRYFSIPIISVLIFSILTGYPSVAIAQNYYGGQITADPVSLQTLTYMITVTLYAPRGGDMFYSKKEIYFGHGKPVELTAEIFDFERSFNADSSIYTSEYKILHTFPGYGAYRIGYRKYNRTNRVSNIKNPVNTPQYLETLLTIDPVMGTNSTPIPAHTFAFQTHTHTRFVHPVQATDPDGDSLTYDLVVPQQNKDTLIEDYRFPDEFDLFYFKNPVREDGTAPPLLTIEEGDLIWDAPNYRGIFTVAIRVHEWRNIQGMWTPLGYVTREIDIYVQDTTLVTSTDKEIHKNEIQLFPNPTSGAFQLRLSGEQWSGGQSIIYNALGQIITQNKVHSSSQYYDLSSQPSGLYFIVLQKNDRHQVQRLVIHK